MNTLSQHSGSELLTEYRKVSSRILINETKPQRDDSDYFDIQTQDNLAIELTKRLKNADRWEALVNQGRIRILGSARLGEDNQHLGLEIWENYPGGQSKETRVNKEILEIYFDTCIKNKRK